MSIFTRNTIFCPFFGGKGLISFDKQTLDVNQRLNVHDKPCCADICLQAVAETAVEMPVLCLANQTIL